MAYVPWQVWQDLYDPEDAFPIGTIFPRTRLSMGGGTMLQMPMNSDRETAALLQKVYTYGFAIDDVILYLDTHPDDCEARRLLQAYARRLSGCLPGVQ